MVLRWLVLLALVFSTAWEYGVEGKSSISLTERESAVERKLKQLNKPAVKTIHSEDGDIIDCVDMYKQPAFDHPLLKNHRIQIKPKTKEDEENSTSTLKGFQRWHKSGSCPDGTIPIRRVKKEELLKATSLEDHGKKPWSLSKHKQIKMNGSNPSIIGIADNHSFAVLVTMGFSYTGAKAFLNVWNPQVESDDEYSSGQIWLTNGLDEYDSVESGWMVNPSLYGDQQTRVFIYWTRDGGKTSGCFDLNCPGFVQVSTKVALGAAIQPISWYDGDQYEYEVYIYEDDGNWWVEFQNMTIGYWPSILFDGLSRGVAEIVEFGGDIYSPRVLTSPHTGADMGSGYYTARHFGHAAYIRQPRIRDHSMTLKYPPNAAPFSLEMDCYDVDNYAAVQFTEPYFYYGGPGRSLRCP